MIRLSVKELIFIIFDRRIDIMKYSVDKHERYSTLTLHDHNLNASLAPDLKSQLVIFRNEAVPSLIIDLSEVQYIDSSGLSALLTGKRLWEDFGSYVIFGIKSPIVKKVIQISKLDEVLNIVPSFDEARDLVTMETLERELSSSGEEE